ncbi:hypothetical protein [Desulfotruncus alcoholivorax]|uniref:hypothetical protein n=1 Tax=Desulfotruncus alcoholivorax TaxID=265477 RepID=UPI00041ECF98|nr:hypothetical protein [Desulfotruncus alcoholivorax]
MALVVSIGDWVTGPVERPKNLMERIFEQPLFDAEMVRVELTRAGHPSEVNENILNFLFTWAIIHIGLSAYWFVKYVI